MPDEENGGSLSQDDIDAALAEAGLGGESETTAPSSPADTSSNESDAGFTQADIDAIVGDSEAEASGSPAAQTEPAAVDTRVDSAGRPFDELAAAMADAIESEKAVAAATGGGGQEGSPSSGDATPFEPPRLDSDDVADGESSHCIDLLRDVQLNVKIELGRNRMLVDDVLRLGPGCVVELDKLAGDPVDVFVNDRLVARGEVLVLNDNFCVRINDIVHQGLEEEVLT